MLQFSIFKFALGIPKGDACVMDWSKNGLFDEKERLIPIERTAYSHRKNGLFDEKERLILIESAWHPER